MGHALDAVAGGFGAVHSVFAHAVNLNVESNLWTLLAAEQGDMPFGIRTSVKDFRRFDLRAGDAVHARSGYVGIGHRGLTIDCRAAPRWVPHWPDRVEAGVCRRLVAVSTMLSVRAWPGSAAMAQAVMTALDTVKLHDVLAKVVGRGPGLTPAGDDVLVGIFAVLRSGVAGSAGAAAAQYLGRTIGPLLPTTTTISGHLLRQAEAGLFSRPLQELVAALIADSTPCQVEVRLGRLLATGATSGSDVCTGLLAAAPLFLLPHQKKGLPHEYEIALLPEFLQGLGFADDRLRQTHGGDRNRGRLGGHGLRHKRR